MAAPQPLILHNYQGSPYAHKAILALNLKQCPWLSCTQPSTMPRPHLTPLFTAGYRRIPILQVGADFYCETNLILQELDERFPASKLAPSESSQGLSLMLGPWLDSTLARYILSLMPFDEEMPGNPLFKKVFSSAQFRADREKMMGYPIDTKKMLAARPRNLAQVRAALTVLDNALSSSPWLLPGSQGPSWADISAYPGLFMLLNSGSAPELEPFPSRVVDWVSRMVKLARDRRHPDAAKPIAPEDAEKVAVSASASIAKSRSGDLVRVKDATLTIVDRAVLVRDEPLRFAVEWTNERGETVRLHFPRTGYHTDKIVTPSKL